MKKIFLNFFIVVGLAIPVFAQSIRLSDLVPGTEIDILLDQPSFYTEYEILWKSDQFFCTVSTHTHFDKKLVASLKSIRYFVTRTSFQDVTGKYNTKYSSQWGAQLDHENKSLPALSISCFSNDLGDFSTSTIESLTNTQITFSQKIIRSQPLTPLNELMPNYPNHVEVQTPLSFAFKSTSQSSGIPTHIIVMNGKIIPEGTPISTEKTWCRLSYSWSSVSSDQKIVLQPGTVLGQNWITQNISSIDVKDSYYSFMIQSEYEQGLSISCNHPTGFTSFSEIQNQLKGIIEFKAD